MIRNATRPSVSKPFTSRTPRGNQASRTPSRPQQSKKAVSSDRFEAAVKAPTSTPSKSPGVQRELPSTKTVGVARAKADAAKAMMQMQESAALTAPKQARTIERSTTLDPKYFTNYQSKPSTTHKSESSATVENAPKTAGERREAIRKELAFRESDRGLLKGNINNTSRWKDSYAMHKEGKYGFGTADNKALDQNLRGTDGRGISDKEIKDITRQHKAELQKQGKFDGWSSDRVERWEAGVTDFLKERRDGAVYRTHQPGTMNTKDVLKPSEAPIETLPKTRAEANMDPVAVSRTKKRLDAWEERELNKLETLANTKEGERPAWYKRDPIDLRSKRDDIKNARKMYELMTIGGENGDLHDLPHGTREKYFAHLRENPGDIHGAFKKVQSEEGLRQFKAINRRDNGGHYQANF